MKKSIAFFDFDGTLTTKDSMFEIVRFVHGNQGFYRGMIQLLPILVGFKFGLVGRQRTKEFYLKQFFSGWSAIDFQNKCNEFSELVIPKLLRADGLQKILWHQKKGHEVVIVSASAENWLINWCNTLQIQCIGTKLQISEDKITGKILGTNCHGEQKVVRIKSLFNLSDYETIYAYGDTSGDRPMLAIADQPFYRAFN